MGELRRLASQGIPDGAGIRCTVWKVRAVNLVNYRVEVLYLCHALDLSSLD